MPKIDPDILKHISHTVSGQEKNTGKTDPLPGSDFKDLLDQKLYQKPNQKLEQGQKADSGQRSKGLGEISGTFKAQQLKFEFNSSVFKDRLEASINGLERYAQWLSDPQKTLKDTHNLLYELSEQTDDLKKKLAPATTTHQDLAQILDHLRMTIKTEQIKLNRGDYL